MTTRWRVLAVGLVVVPLLSLPTGGAAQAASSPVPVSVSVAPATMSLSAGEHFRFSTTVHNDSQRPLTGLIAHLNVVALDPDVYVDPEDWSSHRTQYLAAIPAGGSRRLSWQVQAVGSGRFVLYVGVVQHGAPTPVAGSAPLRLDVSQRRVLGADSVLPLAAAVPAGVLALLLGVARRRRRLG